MCGIAGILRFDGQPASPRALTEAQRAMATRGPDDLGSCAIGPCALTHTRLSILDHVGGAQPMTAPALAGHGELAVVFNGEIYNHRALRAELQSLGHRFNSDHSDTEVLLISYRQWGMAMLQRLQGMFAFALYDAHLRVLILARDPIGKKPLFYHHDGSRFSFASTPGAIRTLLPAEPPMDRRALARYLTLGYTGVRTLHQGVHQLSPGCAMRINSAGQARAESYWSLPAVDHPPRDRQQTIQADLAQAIHAAVRTRLEADVPVGCFLSGGVDSALVAAVAQSQMDRRLQTFSVAMPDPRYDESRYAQLVANHLGTEHHPLQCRPDIDRDLRSIIGTSGQPLADSSILPTYWLSAATKQHVAVALSGDGGDELFGGYDRYRAMRLLGGHGRWIRHLPLPRLDASAVDGKSARSKLERFLNAARQPTAGARYLQMVRLFSRQHLAQLQLEHVDDEILADWPADMADDDAARRWDIAHYLPDDLLTKVDRASMAVGLEVRCPLLDRNIIDQAAALPLSVLCTSGRPKALLKRIAAPLLPPEILKRPKMGFAIPLAAWFRHEMKGTLHDHLIDGGELERIGLPSAVCRGWAQDHLAGKANHAHRLFALLSLSIWRSMS